MVVVVVVVGGMFIFFGGEGGMKQMLCRLLYMCVYCKTLYIPSEATMRE